MHRFLMIIAIGLMPAAALAQTVTVRLDSPQNGTTVAPGSTVTWTISFTDSTGNNQGLSLLSTDLVQAAGNPAALDIPRASGVPSQMTNFSRPAGITNPPDAGATTGYVGVQRGTAGHRNLIQIGGGQNTFGLARPGTGLGESANVVAGVGQGGSQVLATGSFTIPTTAGAYTFSLANTVANVLMQRNNAPQLSPSVRADIVLAQASITVTVGSSIVRGDTNCDGSINNFDIDPFVLALTNPAQYHAQFPNCNILSADCDNNGVVNNFDIDPFVFLLTH